MHHTKKLMSTHGIWIILLLASNILLIAEFFVQGSKAAVFDGNAHIVTLAQFYKALKDGEFPVMWADGFANYGLPLGTISHQVTNYAGGVLTFLTNDPLTSYYLLVLVAVIFSALGFYMLLATAITPSNAFLGAFVYTFATYRITNIYVRGALPELFATIWLPYILILLLEIRKNGSLAKYIVLTVLLALLALTHPMSIIIYFPFVLLAFIVISGLNVKSWIKLASTFVLALMLVAYYIVPLQLEKKYLYYAAIVNNYTYDQAVTWGSIFDPFLKYACSERNYIFWRCAEIKIGIIESTTLILTVVYILFIWFRTRYGKTTYSDSQKMGGDDDQARQNAFLLFAVLGSTISLLMSSVLVENLYMSVPLLGSIQLPSRFLSIFYFCTSLLVALVINLLPQKKIYTLIWTVVIVLIVFLQFPQIYGKNYTNIPKELFYASVENYHGFPLQPKWTLDSREYPVYPAKGEVVRGTGKIISRELKNASRRYVINASTDVVVNDHTFYFPGWNVYIDGKLANIEFQDPEYKGVITFEVPSGTHEVYVVYEDTKLRLLGKILTISTAILLLVAALSIFLRSFLSKK